MTPRRAALLAALLAVPAAPAARAETLVAALSTPLVSVTSNFAGTDVTVFGSIAPDHGKAAPAKGYEIAVVIDGPHRGVLVRRKERIAGVWVNRAGRLYPTVPMFRAVASTLPLAMIARPDELRRLDLGFSDMRLGDEATAADGEAKDFREAIVRVEKARGLYADYPTSVSFLGDQLFATSIPIPAEVPVGHYEARVVAFADGRVVASRTIDLLVHKTGFEQVVADLAAQRPVLYGALSVAIALLTGWIGGVLFRRD